MEIEILLKKVLSDHRLDTRGVVQKIARDLDLHRHTIGRLYRNEATNPSIDVLQRICEWLQAHGVKATELPHALLGSRPSALIEALAAPGKVTIYLGEYQQTEGDEPVILWVSRRDSTVAGEFVQVLSTPTEDSSPPMVFIRYVPSRLVAAGSRLERKQFLEDQARANEIFRHIWDDRGRGSSILVGSQRTNHLVELLVSRLFNAKPFQPPGETIQVPFYLAYRSKERAMPSCFGGLKNPPGRRGRAVPGTYYLDAREQWVCCPWKQGSEDSGLVITVYEPGMGVQMAVFGFSGRGTEAMGRQFLLNAAPFWRSQVPWQGGKVGIYVCTFTIETETSPEVGEVIHAKHMKVVPLDAGILEKYLHRTRVTSGVREETGSA